MPSVFRSAALAVALAAVSLTGCSAARSAASPDTPSAASEALALADVMGAWAFVATRGGHRMTGTFTFSPDGTEIASPDGIVDPVVRESSLAVEADTLRWSGVVSTLGGPTRFEVAATRRGDALVGTNEIAGVGTYAFEATR